MRGGEAGVYATYLNGGLFVDTLFKTTFLEIDPNNTPGFSGSLMPRPGASERIPAIGSAGRPTIAVVWSALDNLKSDDNKISFDEGTN